MKRLLDCTASDFKNITAEGLKQAILASEGRVVVGETVVSAAPLLEKVTNAEVIAAFGADLILLNEFDVFKQEIVGLYECDEPIQEIKNLTGRPVGINLEPVNEAAKVKGEKVKISEGRIASKDTFKKAKTLGIDFVVLTGNPATGVTVESIKEAISTAKKHYNGLLIAGKMHGAGTVENIIDEKILIDYIKAGADGVLIPTVGTIPGITENIAHGAVKAVKEFAPEAIVMSSIGTSQESADEETIRQFALSNKNVGTDIHHIGDGGYGRMPTPENITTLSIAIRGKRHTYSRMAQSIYR